jgi:uncharacterized protein (DUF1697 family)
MQSYVALLRGINVGGNNLIKMLELRACFEAAGFQDVTTYIQSGNVLFSSEETDQDKLVDRIETLLTKTFSYKARVMLRSQKQMKDIVAKAPKHIGTQPDTFHYDVIFLRPNLSAAEVMKNVSVREGVDTAAAGQGVLYFSRLTSKLAQSRMPRIASMPMYQDMTIRSWSTTIKLLGLLEHKRD